MANIGSHTTTSGRRNGLKVAGQWSALIGRWGTILAIDGSSADLQRLDGFLSHGVLQPAGILFQSQNSSVTVTPHPLACIKKLFGGRSMGSSVFGTSGEAVLQGPANLIE